MVRLTETAGQVKYRELFRYSLEPDIAHQIPKTTNGNFVWEVISLRKKSAKLWEGLNDSGKQGRETENKNKRGLFSVLYHQTVDMTSPIKVLYHILQYFKKTNSIFIVFIYRFAPVSTRSDMIECS